MVRLNIENGEEEETLLLSIDPGLQKSAYEYCLVGYFLTASFVHFTAMNNTMANLWHPLDGVQILDLGERRFLFKFFHEMDVERVVNGTPWMLNGGRAIMDFGWNLSLKVQTRRTTIVNSVWLREEGDDDSKKINQNLHGPGSNSMNELMSDMWCNINLILGFNFEGHPDHDVVN
ncbi:hypothetical protein Golob_007042 [Gossypium lobatum]|uniref:DUF4283 domain-containing protein n=1 Tax=Gossypium lobatum TaxID=34289 RepID=A0A7J8NE95_9ROSI|nr:hypothetical protein [Gossypium lobatum]